MPSILRDIPAVAWVAGKNFSYQGNSYTVGQEIPEINEFPRLEVFVRTRHVIPVVETKDDIPFQFRHVVMTRERAIRKLEMGHARGAAPGEKHADKKTRELNIEQAEGEFDPADHNIDEVLSYVGEDSVKATEVYVAEEQGKNRSTLLSQLEDIINKEAADV